MKWNEKQQQKTFDFVSYKIRKYNQCYIILEKPFINTDHKEMIICISGIAWFLSIKDMAFFINIVCLYL